MGATETRKLEEYPLFDWLRLLLAAAVAAYHVRLLPWGEAGNLAVQVFFALSGWLIGTILIEMRSDKLPLFYFNRATRVWAPYLAAIVALYGVSALRDPVTARWFEFLAYDVTFTHNIFTLQPDAQQALAEMPLKGTGNHFWSLAVEEQFYLFSPLLIFFVPGARSPWFWVVGGLVAIALGISFGSIAFGVAAAAAQHRHPGFARGLPIRAGMVVLMIVAVAAMIVSHDYYGYVSPFFAISTVLLLARPGARGPIGKFAGSISYPVYLNHWVGIFAANLVAKHMPGLPTLLVQIAGVAGGIAAGTVGYLLVDRPVLARRNGWYTPARGWVLAGTAYLLLAAGIAIGFAMGRR